VRGRGPRSAGGPSHAEVAEANGLREHRRRAWPRRRGSRREGERGPGGEEVRQQNAPAGAEVAGLVVLHYLLYFT